MSDEYMDTSWHIDIEFDEDDTHTHATVRVQLADGETLTTRGDAYRHPHEVNQPMVGEEIAAARGLIALGTELLHAARDPVRLYR